MIAAMIFITPGAIRPAISTATAATVATVVTKVASNECLEDACCRLCGLDATTTCVSTALVRNDASLTATTTTPSVDNAIANALPSAINNSNDASNDENHDEDEDSDDTVSIASSPRLPEEAHVVDFEQPSGLAHAPEVVSNNSTTDTWDWDTDYIPTLGIPFFQWAPQELFRPLATDALATIYFDMIRTDDKYATLSADKKHAAIHLLNVLHLVNHRRSFDLDYEFAVVDIVVRVLLQAKSFVEAYWS